LNPIFNFCAALAVTFCSLVLGISYGKSATALFWYRGRQVRGARRKAARWVAQRPGWPRPTQRQIVSHARPPGGAVPQGRRVAPARPLDLPTPFECYRGSAAGFEGTETAGGEWRSPAAVKSQPVYCLARLTLLSACVGETSECSSTSSTCRRSTSTSGRRRCMSRGCLLALSCPGC